ncbi:MAG TPA: response regulator transcription factor [Actinomycetota bacterium]|nr:response regulator transcription factor [Actinomycetota bacterium]
MAKVLVVEDDPTMCEMLAYNLRREGFEVDTAADGESGLLKANSPEISMMILDLMLPGMDGMQITQEVRRRRNDLIILMLTARTEEKVRIQGFGSGIDDFLAKPFSMGELVARVKALLRRSRMEAVRTGAPPELVFGDLKIVARDFRCWVGETEIELRPKELTLLTTLASEPGRLFSRAELADKVWGYDKMIDTRTIDTHIKNLRRKVEAPSAYTYISTVRGVGYRFRVKPKES